jgi:LCP family protein required for cell wall assembly
MADTRSPDGLARTGEDPRAITRSLIRRRRGLRITLVSLASAAVLLGAVTAGAYTYVNQALSSIHRVPVGFLTREEPSGGMTMLLTSSQRPSARTGLIMLLRINADGPGGAVSIPADTVVYIPGHGELPLMNATALGGPSLLTETVGQLTGLPVNHYLRIDFDHVTGMTDAIGGGQIKLPRTTESPLRQQGLIRAVLDKLATRHLLTSPLTMYHVLHALPGMLTVDSTCTNADIENLAGESGGLRAGAGTFITAPTVMVDGTRFLDADVSAELWSAMSEGALAAFAREFPGTVTPLPSRAGQAAGTAGGAPASSSPAADASRAAGG